MANGTTISWNAIGKEIVSKFSAIVTDSPAATVGLVLSTFLGYGISFSWFEYRRPKEDKLPMLLHLVIGLGYAGVIFIAINYDILTRNLNVEQISQRLPITLLVSFSLAFVLIIVGVIYRQRS